MFFPAWGELFRGGGAYVTIRVAFSAIRTRVYTTVHVNLGERWSGALRTITANCQGKLSMHTVKVYKMTAGLWTHGRGWPVWGRRGALGDHSPPPPPPVVGRSVNQVLPPPSPSARPSRQYNQAPCRFLSYKFMKNQTSIPPYKPNVYPTIQIRAKHG